MCSIESRKITKRTVKERAAKVLETHGKEVAEHVDYFEARQIRDVQELARLRGIDCEFEEAMVSDVCLDEAGSLRTGQALSRVVADGVFAGDDLYEQGMGEDFRFGLELFLDGVAAHIARVSSRSTG